MEAKSCEMCAAPRVHGERFCPTHRAEMIRRMEDDGYIRPAYKRRMPARLPGPPPVSRVERLVDDLDRYRDRANDGGMVDGES